MSSRDLRTVPRYFLNPSLPAIVDDQLVQLVDLSVKGARLQLDAFAETGRTVTLVIVTDRGNLKVKAEILWCEIDTLQIDAVRDRYLAGVAFRHEINDIDVLIEDMVDRDLAIRITDARDHDRYRLTTPMTATFGDLGPVSVVDLSVRGARIGTRSKIEPGTEAQLRFQVDGGSGPIDVKARVVWTAPSIGGGEYAGLLIEDQDETLRRAIHDLCSRGEARIDLESLRRKFEMLRAQAPGQQMAG